MTYNNGGSHTFHTHSACRISQDWFTLVSQTLWLQLTANQFILSQSPMRFMTRWFFFATELCGHSPYVTSSLTRGWVCLLWIGFAFVKCTYHTYSMLLKILLCALYMSPGFANQIMSILCYNGSLVAWTVVTWTTTMCKHLIFFVWFRFALCCEHVHSHDLCDFCLLPA
jgi:hypothetical protein